MHRLDRLRKELPGALRKARLDRARSDAATDAPTAYDRDTGDGFRAALRLTKLAHGAGPSVSPPVATAPQTVADAVTKRRAPATTAAHTDFAGVGGIDPAGFAKALTATREAQSRPRALIPDFRQVRR